MLSSAPALPAAWRRPLLALGLLLAALLLLYFDTAAAMVGIWSRSDTFAHAFLVPPISIWLIWRGRDRLANLQPRPDLRWLPLLVAAALLWLAADLVAVNAAAQFAFVAMLVLLVPLVLGWPATRAMLFPLLFLFFCVPVGEFLLPALMEGTADFTVAALRLSGIPVFREGLQFVIPSGYWSVVEACSGVRYLIASLMVGSLFAYLNYQSLTRRLVFVGISIIVPIVANWLRAYMIVMLGHLSNNRIATGVDHLVYGWVFFGVVILIMFMIGARWSEPDREHEAPDGSAPLAAAGLDGRRFVIVALLAGLMLVLPQGVLLATRTQVSDTPVRLDWPVPAQAGWAATSGAAPWQVRFVGPSEVREQVYRNGPGQVGVMLAYYRAQTRERKLVSSVNTLVSSEDSIWHAVGSSRQQTTFGDQTVAWRATHLLGRTGSVTSQRRHLTVWQVYWVDDQFTASDVQAKLGGAQGLLAGRGDDGAALLLYTEAEPSEGGHRQLAEFAQAHLPALREALRKAREAR
ncbi:exosortase A [Pseudorhodoferax sp.]|uniref:exosortase A n=1 Tax=Pseudorhodoferax sp. TaxID=1993553 RepID=UPI002DD62BA7|nr:exosortase A [Pseudorhodoferax sp.]